MYLINFNHPYPCLYASWPYFFLSLRDVLDLGFVSCSYCHHGFSTGLSDVLGLAVHGDHIYWTDRGNIEQSLARADKNDGRNKEPLVMNVGGFHGLIAVNQSTNPGRNDNGCTCNS